MQNAASVEERICTLLADILNLDPQSVTLAMSMESTEAWDSLQHLSVVQALEEEFSRSVSPEDIQKLSSVEAIVAWVSNAT